jgi:hypothetical protein
MLPDTRLRRYDAGVSCRSRLLWRVRVAGACQVRADPVKGNDARNAGEESADAPLGQGWWQ